MSRYVIENVAAEQQAEAAHLARLHAEAVAADRATANNTTSATVDASFAAHDRLRDACEEFRRRHFPRAYRVAAAFGEVFTVSRTGRSVRLVWSGRDD